MSYSFPRIPTAFSSRFLLSSLLFTGCLSTINATATANTPGASLSSSDFGASISALFSSRSIGYGDAMVPLFSRNENFFYVDPQVLFHTKDNYTASLGFGKRWLQSEQAGVLGAYVFADYSHSAYGNSFWFVSPGIERLGKSVDFSANLYVPISNSRIFNGAYYGNQLGIYDYVRFQGNSQYDQLFNNYESVGVGGDAEVGFRLPFSNNPKIYVGGYYASPKQAESIHGGTVRLEVPVSKHLALSLSDGYDNVAHNTIKLGMTYNLGSRHNSLDFKGDLADRMLDPVRRNLASVAGAATATQPIAITNVPTGTEGDEYPDITFFNRNGDPNSQDGTFEHPYIQFNQANVDSANAQGNTMLYVSSGTYSSNATITLTNDSIWGRQTYNGTPFAQPAQGDNRPLFDFSGMPSIVMPGYMPGFNVNQNGADITFDSIRLIGNPTNINQSGISLNNTSTTPVNLTYNNVDSRVFVAGIYVNNTGMLNNLTINNSTFDDAVNVGQGVQIWNYSSGIINTITVDNSHFDNNNWMGMEVISYGGIIDTINIKNSTFDGNSGSGVNNIGQGLWIIASTSNSGDTSTINHINIDSSDFSNNISRNGMGLYILNSGSLIGDININNTTMNGNGSAGLRIDNSGTMGNITVDNSAMNNNGNGMVLANSGGNGGNNVIGQVLVENSTMNNNLSVGFYIQNWQAAPATSYIQGITVSNVTISGNNTGIYVNNQGSIGANNEVIIDKVTFANNSGINTRCEGASIKNPDGTIVYCR